MIVKKIIEDICSVQSAIVETVKENRYLPFTVGHWSALLEAKRKMTVAHGQSKDVIELYKMSADTNFEIVSSLTNTIQPEDEAWIETLQTPVVVEILCEEDSKFRGSIRMLIKAVEESKDIIGAEAFRRIFGAYGSTWIVDYVASPGSMLNIFLRVMNRAKIPRTHQSTILACVSASRVTTYCTMLGSKLLKTLETGGSLTESIEAEKDMLIKSWLNPVETQSEILRELNFTSFEPKIYMERFRSAITDVIRRAVKAEVHYSNIILIPAWGAGDFHHVGQTIYNICKDDVAMAVLEATYQVLEKTLKQGLEEGKLKDPFRIPVSDITAAAVARLMESEGFASYMVSDLFTRRFYNLSLMDPHRLLTENLNSEFLHFISRGEKILKKTPMGHGGKIKDLEVDLSPLEKNEVLRNPQRYSFPPSPLTVVLPALLKFADDPFQLETDPALAIYMTNLIALNPRKAILPVAYCKACVEEKFIPARCRFCFAER